MWTTAAAWSDLIPESDVRAFGGAFKAPVRQVELAGPTAVVVVDMTRRFVDGRYPTGHSASGMPATFNCVPLLAAARTSNVPIFYSLAYPNPTHRPLDSEIGIASRKSSPATHESDLPPGDVVVDELAPTDDDALLYKGKAPSVFFGTSFAAQLHYHGTRNLVIVGMTTSGCVRATAVDAYQFNMNVIIPVECVADRSDISHRVNLFDMNQKYASVVTTADLISELSAR